MLNLDEYRDIVENSPHMVWCSGIDKMYNYFNQTWLAFTGKSIEQVQQGGWCTGIHEEDRERCSQIYDEHFNSRQPYEMIYRFLRADGEYRWINDRGQPRYNESGNFVGYIGSCIDVTDQVIGTPFKQRVSFDGLTGVYSRQQFFELAIEEIDRARINHSSLALLLLDVDRFRTINVQYGHAIGDNVLKKVAEALKKSIRTHDLVGRFGGDEFIIGLTDTDINGAKIVWDRIIKEIHQLNLIYDMRPISLSMGVAFLEEDMGINGLLDLADQRLTLAREKDADMSICYE